MSETALIQRKIFGRTSFKNVVDTEFNQLVPKDSSIAEKPESTVSSFFEDYDNLFYEIPLSGSNSHLDLVNKSSEYLGISFTDLQDEISDLRLENVSLKNQIFTLTQG